MMAMLFKLRCASCRTRGDNVFYRTAFVNPPSSANNWQSASATAQCRYLWRSSTPPDGNHGSIYFYIISSSYRISNTDITRQP